MSTRETGTSSGRGRRQRPRNILSIGYHCGVLALTAVAPGVGCGDRPADLGTASRALGDPPPKPDFPEGVIVPTEPVGYLPGAGSVSPSGTAGYQIPLDVPPGRLGVQPDLALSYSSGGDNGLVGVGWGLTGLAAIARCPRTHASGGQADGVDWDATDAFCLNDQRLVGGTPDPNDNTLVFRTEHESFTEVRAHLSNGGSPASPSKFVARQRDGRTLVFTPLEAHRVQVHPQLPNVLQSWNERVVWPVSQVDDRSGNLMLFSYDSGAETSAPFSFWYRPRSIRYTYSAANLAVPALREVRFIYEDRLDRPLTYASGLRTVLRERLSRVEMQRRRLPVRHRRSPGNTCSTTTSAIRPSARS